MKPLMVANWKMNMNMEEAVCFISGFKKYIKNVKKNEIVICPPFTILCELKNLLSKTNIKLGSQNMHFEDKGAFTGEISASMLKDTGCDYVILGHSERRQFFNENDRLINQKIKTALRHNLKPILCVGETLGQKTSNQTTKIIKNQLLNCLNTIEGNDIKNIVIAYEPVWAIGTGKNATPEQAEDVHKFIRGLLSNMYNQRVSNNTWIIYGGSVKESNIKALMKMKNINGALVGGASLDAKGFGRICS